MFDVVDDAKEYVVVAEMEDASVHAPSECVGISVRPRARISASYLPSTANAGE